VKHQLAAAVAAPRPGSSYRVDGPMRYSAATPAAARAPYYARYSALRPLQSLQPPTPRMWCHGLLRAERPAPYSVVNYMAPFSKTFSDI